MIDDAIYFPLILVSMLSLAAWHTRKIDGQGAFAGAIISYILVLSVGWFGLVSIGCFFVAGTVASIWKIEQKKTLGLAEKHNVQRGLANVLANSLVPAVCAGIGLIFPTARALMEILIAAGFAAATSDTLSSEMGNIYGTKYINIVTLKADKRGKDGVISIEGLLFGVFGSLLIALLYFLFTLEAKPVWIVAMAGFGGNLLDSLFGATFQQKGYLNNHTVNLLNTLGACLLAMILLAI